MSSTHLLRRSCRFALVATLTIAIGPAYAQTQITPPPNKYSPADDVKAGQEAAQQALKQLPMLNDAATEEYVAGIGQRLVAAIPPNLQHPEFHYTFRVVNQKDINAFALPGGPMFVNRGMIESAHDEGEIAHPDIGQADWIARPVARDDKIETRFQAFRGRQKFGALFVIRSGRKRT